MDKLSAVIVDDEPLALNFLRGILSKFPSIDIVAECKNGREAVAAVRSEEHTSELQSR